MLGKKILIIGVLFSFGSWLFFIGYLFNNKFHEWIGVLFGVLIALAMVFYYLWQIADIVITTHSARNLYITCITAFVGNTTTGLFLFDIFKPTPIFDLKFTQIPMSWLFFLTSLIILISAALARYVDIADAKL
jgi:hypothetical protein